MVQKVSAPMIGFAGLLSNKDWEDFAPATSGWDSQRM